MDNSIIGEFSILSPSQKKELERKRKEKEARETAEAIRKAETAQKAREEAKFAEERRLAAIRAENATREAEKESKRNRLKFLIVILCVLVIIIIWVWIHYFNVNVQDMYKGKEDNIGDRIVYGVIYFPVTGIIVVPILIGIVVGIKKLKDKIKAIK